MSGDNLWCKKCKSHHHVVDDCQQTSASDSSNDLLCVHYKHAWRVIIANGGVKYMDRVVLTCTVKIEEVLGNCYTAQGRHITEIVYLGECCDPNKYIGST